MFTWDGNVDARSPTSLAESVRAGFESVAAQTQTSWLKQHDRNGAHKDVTARSVTIAGALIANGRVGLGPPLHVNRPLTAATRPFYPGAGGRQEAYGALKPSVDGGRNASLASFLRITTSSLDPDPLVWHGLDAAGREEGDVVVFLNDGNTTIEFVSQSGSTPLGTQFFANSFLPSGNYELGSGGLGIVVYSTNQFLGAKFWHWVQMG